jgi:prephenate dehydratase
MLVGVSGATLEEIAVVRSHPVALEQCGVFLRAHPAMRAEVVDDTAGAVRRMVETGDPQGAAIGSALAARRYGGVILARDVHDDPTNVTRLFAIARDGEPRRAPTRACVAMQLAHRPGSLRDALDAVARRILNLRSLVARPIRGQPFEYAFYLEFDCPDRPTLEGLLAELDSDSHILGFY